MESFFDIKEFLVTILRRLRLIILVMLLASIAWATVRFIPLMIEYLTFDDTLPSDVSQSMDTDFPYYFGAKRTVYIDSSLTVYNNAVVDRAAAVSAAYLALATGKETFGVMVDLYYEDIKADSASMKEKMVQYNYRTRAAFGEKFTMADILSLVTVESPTVNVVNITVKSGDAALSEKMANELEKLLTDAVIKTVGEFTHTTIQGEVEITLPEPTTGLIPKTASVSSDYVAGTRPELSFILVRSVKGGVWGAIAGFALSILIIFFIHAIGIQVESEKDLQKYKRPVVVMSDKKRRRLFGLVDWLIAKLEGRITTPISLKRGGEMVYERLRQSEPTDGEILLTGCCEEARGRRFAEALQIAAQEKGAAWTVTYSPCITYFPETVAALADARHVVLLEQVNRSNKAEIEREIALISEMHRTVSLFVLMD